MLAGSSGFVVMELVRVVEGSWPAGMGVVETPAPARTRAMNEATGSSRDAASILFNLLDYRVVKAVDLPGGGRQVLVESLSPPGCPSCDVVSEKAHPRHRLIRSGTSPWPARCRWCWRSDAGRAGRSGAVGARSGSPRCRSRRGPDPRPASKTRWFRPWRSRDVPRRRPRGRTVRPGGWSRRHCPPWSGCCRRSMTCPFGGWGLTSTGTARSGSTVTPPVGGPGTSRG